MAAEVIDIGSVCPAVLQVQPSEFLAYLFWPAILVSCGAIDGFVAWILYRGWIVFHNFIAR